MTWQALQDGLHAWFVAASGINVLDVFWDDEPEGFLGRPYAMLKLRSHNTAGGSDEIRYDSNGPDADASVVAVGNRTMTFSVRVRTRDAAAEARPYALLERVRAQLELPSTQDAFAAVGVGLIGTAALVDLTRVWDRRREPEALLDLRLSAVSDTSDLGIDESVGTIEHVRVGGTVTSGGVVITTADQTIS